MKGTLRSAWLGDVLIRDVAPHYDGHALAIQSATNEIGAHPAVFFTKHFN